MLMTKKAHEGDFVELTEEMPKYHLKRGQRGFVIEAFDEPDEAYDLEFEDENGEFMGFAYSVSPSEIENVGAIANEAFERGKALGKAGRHAEAVLEFRRAVKIQHDYVGVLNNSMVKSFEGSDDWQRRITAMRLVLRVDPDYQIARNNLAIAFMNYGVQKAAEGDLESSRELHHLALSVGPSPEIASDLQRNIGAAYTGLGMRAHEAGRFEEAHMHFRNASAFHPSDQTRHNLALSCASCAFWLMDLGRIEEATNLFERAQDGGLITPRLLNDYAVALASSARMQDAELAIEMAIEIEPDNEILHQNLATIRRGLSAPVVIGQTFVLPYPPALEGQLPFLPPHAMSERSYVAA
jgi:tetratricopeptide (TPR) repeat protein